MHRSLNVQLMRPATLAPFLPYLDVRGLDTNGLLADVGLTRRAVHDNAGMVTAKQVHAFVHDISTVSGDRFSSWTIGRGTNPRKYLMYSNLVSRENTLGDAFTRLSLSAAELSTASRFELFVDGAIARLSGQRLYRSEPVPHTDVFVIGTLVELMRFYLGKHMTASRLTISTYDPQLIPKDFGCRLRASTELPAIAILEFPSNWLLTRPGHKPPQVPMGSGQPQGADLIEFLASALEPHLDNAGLTAEVAARICDGKLREINRCLTPQGVTLADLISAWRSEKACSLLQETDERIADIGTAVGYPDPTSFSRAFRQWTGMSPRQYRIDHS